MGEVVVGEEDVEEGEHWRERGLSRRNSKACDLDLISQNWGPGPLSSHKPEAQNLAYYGTMSVECGVWSVECGTCGL